MSLCQHIYNFYSETTKEGHGKIKKTVKISRNNRCVCSTDDMDINQTFSAAGLIVDGFNKLCSYNQSGSGTPNQLLIER